MHPCARTEPAGRSNYTVAQVIERFHESFFARYGDSLSFEQRKALQAILQCRTELMGGHRCYCTQCQESHFFYHSCNHRNCPICGTQDTAVWVEQRLEQALPLPHYMITFTLPAQLRPLCMIVPEKIYPLFFRCAAQAIKDILANPRHLGIEAGFFGVLQTWQQNLTLHPHIHFIVPAGGLAPGGNLIVAKKQWLVWGDVFAKRLKNRLLTELKQHAIAEQTIIDACWKIDWNADVENFGNGYNAIKYLGRYIYKSAISDSRIEGIDDTHVTFTVKDRQTKKTKCIRITGEDFLMRYFTHVLPSRFHRIRYYGFMHPRAKATFAIIQALLLLNAVAQKQVVDKPEPAITPFKCPKCGNPMDIIEYCPRAPPQLRTITWIWQPAQKVA